MKNKIEKEMKKVPKSQRSAKLNDDISKAKEEVTDKSSIISSESDTA